MDKKERKKYFKEWAKKNPGKMNEYARRYRKKKKEQLDYMYEV